MRLKQGTGAGWILSSYSKSTAVGRGNPECKSKIALDCSAAVEYAESWQPGVVLPRWSHVPLPGGQGIVNLYLYLSFSSYSSFFSRFIDPCVLSHMYKCKFVTPTHPSKNTDLKESWFLPLENAVPPSPCNCSRIPHSQDNGLLLLFKALWPLKLVLCLQVCPYLYDQKLPGQAWWKIMNIRSNKKKKFIFLLWPSSIIHKHCSFFQLSALQQHIPERHVLCLDIQEVLQMKSKHSGTKSAYWCAIFQLRKKCFFLSWQLHSLTIERITALSVHQFLLNNVPSSFKLGALCCLRQTRKWDFLFLFF